MKVVLTSVAFGGSAYGVILVGVVVFEQGMQRLHQPEAEEEDSQETRCRVTFVYECAA